MTNQVSESAQPVSPGTTPTVPDGAARGQATSPDIGAVLARLEKAEQELRGLQSVGDKREAKLTEKYAVLEDYIKRTGGQLDQRTLRDMQVDEILASRNSPQTASPGSGAPLQTPQPSVDYLAPLKVVGLDANDNEVLALMVKHNGNQDGYNAALLALKTQRLAQPTPSSAAIPAPSGNVATSSTLEQLQARMTELARNPSANKQALREIATQMDALG